MFLFFLITCLILEQILQKRHWLKKSKLAAQRAGRVYCNRNALIPKFGPEAYSTCISVDKE